MNGCGSGGCVNQACSTSDQPEMESLVIGGHSAESQSQASCMKCKTSPAEVSVGQAKWVLAISSNLLHAFAFKILDFVHSDHCSSARSSLWSMCLGVDFPESASGIETQDWA